MTRLLLTTAIALVPGLALADGVDGVWETGSDKNGGYLEVTMAPCQSDNAKTCGTISKAFGKEGEDPTYENLGKPIVMDMTADGDGKFSGGTIWNPEDGKTYKSKMALKDANTLEVDGCVLFICQDQDWTRVK